MEQAPPLVADDPEGVAAAVVAQAREIKLLGLQFGMDEPLAGLLHSCGADCRE